jgi:Glycosyl hydrolase family 1
MSIKGRSVPSGKTAEAWTSRADMRSCATATVVRRAPTRRAPGPLRPERQLRDRDLRDRVGRGYRGLRVEYLRSYLKVLQRSIADGTPVRGYFVGCFLDNFEWTDGYTRRFGIVHNNFRTQKRTPKLSARWYQSVVAANRVLRGARATRTR